MPTSTIEGYLSRTEIKSYVRFIMRRDGLTARRAWAEAHKRYIQTKRIPKDFVIFTETSWQD